MKPMPKHDPVGCEQCFPGSDYTEEEVEFLKAVDEYRHRLKRKFLNATDYLRLLHELGYRKERVR